MTQRIARWLVMGAVVWLVAGCSVLRDSPPTVTPIYITATPQQPVIPIVATETATATSVMQATSAALLPTQAPARTATPSPPPPITMTPTFTPTATDTPTTPGAPLYMPVGGQASGGAAIIAGGDVAGSCSNAPQGVFAAIYQSDPNFPAALGCPLSPASASVGSAYQPFQNGVMIWISSLATQPQAVIYALYNNGTYQRFNDTFTESVDPDSGGAVPPDGVLEPVRGFGKVWRENPTVRDTLGWAITGESGGTGQVLVFERGEMVSVSQAGQTYIMITGAPGTWTARSGS